MDKSESVSCSTLREFFASPMFWSQFWNEITLMVPIMCVPAALHLLGLPKAAFILLAVLFALMVLDVLLHLPRFIRAVRNKNSKPYQGRCYIEWSAQGASILIGVLLSKVVGIF